MFNHIRHELPELEQINEASGRYYETPAADVTDQLPQ